MTISDDSSYIVIDLKTKDIVYRTTYKNRKRAKNFADKKDLEYDAIRYVAQLE